MIITLCGSSRFEDWFHVYNRVLSRAGHLVFDMSCHNSTLDRMPFLKLKKLPKASKGFTPSEGALLAAEADDKLLADRLHRKKIAASDAIFVLNAFAYIGESTLSEIQYAEGEGKTVIFLESWGVGCGVGDLHFQWLRRAARTYDVHGPSPIDTSYKHKAFGKDIYGTYDGAAIIGDAGTATRVRCLEMIQAFQDRLQERFE